jgi:hypothetical protein
MNADGPHMSREAWIDAFVTYVLKEASRAVPSQIAAVADRLYSTVLGGYGPEEVAEAEWDTLPLGPHPSA